MTILILPSCNVKNRLLRKPKTYVDSNVKNNTSKDSTILYSDVELDGVPDFIDKDPILGSPNPNMNPYVNPRVRNTNRTPSSVSETTSGEGLIKGLIAYSVPKEMTVGGKYVIKVRVSKEKDATKIIVGDRGIVIADTNTSNVFVEEIRVEPVMSAELMSDKSFEVDTLSTTLQNIDEHGYTEWAWAVRPIKSGENYLRLVVKVRITTDQGVFYKDITVFDKNIKVKANIVFSVKRWISEYWQWLITSIISPLIVWWYKRRKEEKDKPKKRKK